MEKDAYYFPHFCNARHDRKIKRLRKELGIEGYGIFFMLLEVLREQEEFKYPMQDIDLLAEEFGTSEQKINVTIMNYDLFKIDASQLFFSPKFNEFMKPYLTMKEQRRMAGKKSGEARKIKAENKRMLNGCSTDVQRMLNENEQSKVKKSKVNESKVNESKVYGKNNNVHLTDEQYSLLIDKIGYEKTEHYIQKISWWKKEKDADFKDDADEILKWNHRDRTKAKPIYRDA